MVWRGVAGWAEWSPFLDYEGAELVPWLRAAQEAAECEWPAPLRTEIPVNSTIPAVGPERAYEFAQAAGCRTAKVKVAERGQTLAEDVARLEAVRDALDSDG
jgi:O-succinylbenzoate synthase